MHGTALLRAAAPRPASAAAARDASSPAASCVRATRAARCSQAAAAPVARGHERASHTTTGRGTPGRVQAAAGGDVGLFPAGKKQAYLPLPALILDVTSEQVLEEDNGGLTNIDEALSAGLTAVLLRETEGAGAADLYNAAVRLKEFLRDRALLLVLDRTDIAAAAAASGVVLSPLAVPVVVARATLAGSPDALVGRVVSDVDEAAVAAADGANLLVLAPEDGAAPSAELLEACKSGQRSGSSIPIVAGMSSVGSGEATQALLSSGVDGLSVGLDALGSVAVACGAPPGCSVDSAVASVAKALAGEAITIDVEALEAASDAGTVMRKLLSAEREALLTEQKALLNEALELIEEHCPEMQEVSLLKDAIKQLDELFLMVVVGEFNSGKSTVINALLGARFLEDGILPTTNEISVLKHSATGKEEGPTQDADGLFVRKLPAELLRELNIVDTPGTNVILDRQQRLTEEYVPRADLVLFVMSADRPLTDSEVSFLKYIRRWGKKVLFCLNKVDILATDDEVAAVTGFVSDNVQRLLGVTSSSVFPVSARNALSAKEALGSESTGGLLDSMDSSILGSSTSWKDSRFGNLEAHILDFLLGAGEGAGESVRLKMQTPLRVADALLDAAGRQLAEELRVAKEEQEAVASVRKQLASFRRGMERDSVVQRSRAMDVVNGAVARASAELDATLQLSNAAALASLATASEGEAASASGELLEGLEEKAIKMPLADMKSLLAEHAEFVAANCAAQSENYEAFAASTASSLAAKGLMPVDALAAQFTGSEPGSEASSAARDPDASALALVSSFDAKKALEMIADEVSGVIKGTSGAAGGAAIVGFIATSVLPNTLEDLLALSVVGLAAYISVLNLPVQRLKIKSKVNDYADRLMGDIQSRMETELAAGLKDTETKVIALIEPLEQATQKQVELIEAAERRRSELYSQLSDLMKQTAMVE